MATITLDAIEPVQVEDTEHVNEVGTLRTLHRGLWGLANSVANREYPFLEMSKKVKFVSFGRDADATTQDIDMVACFFHWFGVSLCNFARLVGFIRGLKNGEFTRADLTDQSKMKARVIKNSVDAYIQSVPELQPVLVWRDKIAAHFAITDPRKDDNIATLDMSVVFPVAYDSPRYRANYFQMIRSSAAGTHVSGFPEWSVTEVYEQLASRYWPGSVAGPRPAAVKPEE
jgi:hypothetical protein